MSPPPLSRREMMALAAASLAAGCSASSGHPASATPTKQTGPPTRPPNPTGGTVPGRLPPLTPPPGGPAIEVVHGDRHRPLVALTFHGNGDVVLARELLSEVARANAHITVFAVGSWLEANPEMARTILDGGNELANHTYTHPQLGSLSPGEVFSEISQCREVIHRLTGTSSGWFRPSAMDRATALVREQAGRVGYGTCVSFDVDPADYRNPGAKAIRERTLDAVRPGSIVSLHLGHPGTVEALPSIFDGLAAKGLTPVTFSGLFA